MAITVNHATLARQVNNEIEYIYPKTDSTLVEYDSEQNVKEKIDSIVVDTENKVDIPLDTDGNPINGLPGQVLETNGDGTTSWVSRARVYVGSGEMPEGYDVQIDPTADSIEIDTTLSVEGGVAEAKAVGDAIARLENSITNIDAEDKVDKPLDEDGNIINGTAGQVLETNGDGTTSWVSRARVYVGSGEMPEGYDVQIDPNAEAIEIDPTLSIEGGVAEAKAVGDAISRLENSITNIDMEDKVDKPIGIEGDPYNGTAGQVLETNGDGSTSWVSRARVYVGSDEMPEGYDVQIDPDATAIEIDRSLSVDGAVAEASATGAAIKLTREKIITKIEEHNTDIASHTDIRAMITEAKEYLLLIDTVTGEEVKVTVADGKLVCSPAVIKCTGITITTNPTKTSYGVGEAFNPAGMVVTASYNDGTTKVVTNYTYPTIGLTAGTTSVTITYIEGGITVTATVPVTVVIECIGINISTMPIMTEYYIGEVFSPTGMIVSATYTDGTVKAVTNYTYPTTAFTKDMTSITISYVEDETTFTANVPVTVIAKYTGITVTTNPTKTSYYVGDTFNTAGMVVTASYNDGTTKVVTGYTYPLAALTYGTISATISYTERGITHTVNIPITVTPKYTGLSITTRPTKVQYTEGEVFNPAGMVVTASYNNNTTKTVTNYTYPTTALAMGTNSVTISYTEGGITYTANVSITVVSAFNAAAVLQDFTYEANGDGTYTITGWKGTKNGVASTECVVPDSKYVVVNPL